MAKATSLIISAGASLDPILTRLRTPLGWAINDLKVLSTMSKLALTAIGAVAARFDKRGTKLSLVQLSVDNKLRRLARRRRTRKTGIRLAVFITNHSVVAGGLVGMAAAK